MRRLLAVAVPAVLLLAVPASAKEVLSAKVCGADGCKSIAQADERLLAGGPEAQPPAGPEPFVRLSMLIGVPGHHERVSLLFLPRSNLLLGGDGATWMHPASMSDVPAIARRVEAFPASALPASALRVSAGDARSGAPLPAEAYGAASTASASDGGSGAWWPAPVAAAIALAAGAMLVRRRSRREPPAGATSR